MGGIDACIGNKEFWSSVGHWMVVAGLVGDIIVLVVPKHRERLEKLLAAFFTIVIIVGVAIEHRADADISVLVSQEQVATSLQIAQLYKEGGEARKNAGELTRQSEILKRQNLLLQEQVLKLREKMADRRLTGRQQGNVVSKLLQLAGEKANIFAQAGDPETVGLMEDIGTALGKAHWGGSACLEQTVRAVPGILVEVKEDAEERTKRAAVSLVSALQAEGLSVIGPHPGSAGRIEVGGSSCDLTVPIAITIGKKPSKP